MLLCVELMIMIMSPTTLVMLVSVVAFRSFPPNPTIALIVTCRVAAGRVPEIQCRAQRSHAMATKRRLQWFVVFSENWMGWMERLIWWPFKWERHGRMPINLRFLGQTRWGFPCSDETDPYISDFAGLNRYFRSKFKRETSMNVQTK